MNLPKVTSTTELQRNISTLTKADNIHIIIKGTKELGVYIPMGIYNERYQLKENSVGYNRQVTLPPKTLKALKKIDPVKYQRDIRKEY